MRHIQLHPLGGAAGDMFVACLLDAFPEHRDAAVAHAEQLAGTSCRLLPHRDDTLTGARFEVDVPSAHGHGHTHWAALRRRLAGSGLPSAVREHAIGIFTALAEAEGRVHGRPADEVVFHEVGAVDSVADIVAAASVIAAVSPATWSVTPLPLGGGTVQTAHGVMPVPTPATALLLEGFAITDDGVPGERVTPTGAAILRYLVSRPTVAPSGTLRTSGTGFGTRLLPGRSNCLRALVFESGAADQVGHRELAVISFEVDDQSGEELALGLDRIRDAAGVHDVVQIPCFGKKSRLGIHVQVLTSPGAMTNVVDACFRETTTIGLRIHFVQGRALERHFDVANLAGRSMQVKLVERPLEGGGTVRTAKAEAAHVQDVASHSERARLRQQAEAAALKGSEHSQKQGQE